MPLHTKDRDKILGWADEHGWEVAENDPLILTKAGRTLEINTNLSGMPNSVRWLGGDEHATLGSGSSSLTRIRDWMATDLDGSTPTFEEVASVLPETDLQAEVPPPPQIPQPLIDAGVPETPAGAPMVPDPDYVADPAVADPPAVDDAPPPPPADAEPAKKAPAKKAPVKKVPPKKETDDAAKDPEAGGAVSDNGPGQPTGDQA